MARKIIGRFFLWGPFALIMAGLAWTAPAFFWFLVMLIALVASIILGVLILEDPKDRDA